MVSISECRSSTDAGGGAVDARILSITSAGSCLVSFINLSSTSASSLSDMGSGIVGMGGKLGDVGVCVRFDILLQKESRVARVLKTGDVTSEISEPGVEISEPFDWADDGRGIKIATSALLGVADVPSLNHLILGFERNLTRGPNSREVGSSSISKLTSVSCLCGSNEGRVRAVFLAAKVFNAIRARSSTRGMSIAPLTPYTTFRGSSTERMQEI